MTEGFLALPICIPGTAVWKGKQGRLYILDLLEKAAARSKASMKVMSCQTCGLLAVLVWQTSRLCNFLLKTNHLLAVRALASHLQSLALVIHLQCISNVSQGIYICIMTPQPSHSPAASPASILPTYLLNCLLVWQEGNSPRCLMDFWAQRCLEEIKEAEEQKVAAAGHTTDRAMADTVMDFLFASQDATTSAVVWVTVLMADYPDVLQKVRASGHLVSPVSKGPSWVFSNSYLFGEGRVGGIILFLTFQRLSDPMHWQLQASQHEILAIVCLSRYSLL